MRARFSYIMIIAVGLLFATSFTAFAADQKEKKEKKQKKEKVEYIVLEFTDGRSPSVVKFPKAPADVYLELKNGKLNLMDRFAEDFEVSNQAARRLTKEFDRKIGFVYVQKSGKEANMSEELYQQLVEKNEKDNEYLRKIAY